MSHKTQHQVLKMLYVVVLVGLCVAFSMPFIMSLIFASTIALMLYPLQLSFEARGWSRSKAALVITTAFTLLISVPFLYFTIEGTILIIEQLEGFAIGDKLRGQGIQSIVSTIKTDLFDTAQGFLTKYNMSAFITEEKFELYIKQANKYLLGFFQKFISEVPLIVILIFIWFCCTYAFLKEGRAVKKFFQSLFGFSATRMDELVNVFIKDSRQVYMTNIVTGAIQSLMISVGAYFILNLQFFLIFFVTFIVSFIPVVGAGMVGGVIALVAFLQGDITGGIVLGAISVVTGVTDNILRPWLAGFGTSKAPEIVSLVSVLGGALLLGFPGLFIGLLVGALAYDTLPIFWDEIAKSSDVRMNLTELLTKPAINKDLEDDSRPTLE